MNIKHNSSASIFTTVVEVANYHAVFDNMMCLTYETHSSLSQKACEEMFSYE